MPTWKEDANYDVSGNTERRQDAANRLTRAANSDHAGDITHQKSVTGICIKLAGGAVLCKTAYQPTCTLSSTEAEFTAASTARKYIPYLRTILQEISLLHQEDTPPSSMKITRVPPSRQRCKSPQSILHDTWTLNTLASKIG